jgi:hypothetical protein
MQAFQSTPQPRYSPWGAIQTAEQVAPGIWHVTTAGHGGLILSPERYAAMPRELQSNICGRGTAFEEDAEWALVAAWYPEAFLHIPKDELMPMILRALNFDCYRAAHDWILQAQRGQPVGQTLRP